MSIKFDNEQYQSTFLIMIFRVRLLCCLRCKVNMFFFVLQGAYFLYKDIYSRVAGMD